MAYVGNCYWIYAVCDIRMWRHIHACNLPLWRSLLTLHAYYFTCTLLARCCRMCPCNEHKLSALYVRTPEHNTALNAKTEQFITAKISGNSLKQRNTTLSVIRKRSSQLQNNSSGGLKKYSMFRRIEKVPFLVVSCLKFAWYVRFAAQIKFCCKSD